MRFFDPTASGTGWNRRRVLGVGAIGVGALAVGTGVASAFADQAAPSTEGVPPGADWKQVMSHSDGFNHGKLDPRKWTTDYWHDTAKQVAFDPTNVEVSRGKLRLWTKKENLNNKNYTVGTVMSKFAVGGDSYVEVRARMIAFDANVNAAIWMHERPDPDAQKWAVEIDIQESHLNNRHASPTNIHSGFHLWKKEPDEHVIPDKPNPNEEDVKVELDKDFHTYGLERRNGRVTFYFDGKPYWSVKAKELGYEYIATQPRPIILCCNGNAGTPVDAKLPASMDVDYVRVYKAV